jgi:hypothetical protein
MLFPETPTYFPPNVYRNLSIIDGFLLKNVHVTSTPRSISEMSSDHNPVNLTINLSSTCMNAMDVFFDYEKADWNVIKDYLNMELNDVDFPFSNEIQIDDVA